MEIKTLDVSFPTLPSTMVEVKKLIASGRTDPEPLVDIVKRDPSTSVNVLRRANSAYYGLRHEVESVEHAVRLLGFIEVSSVAMIEGADEMQEQFTARTDLINHIMHASVFTGRFAQQLTRQLELATEWTRLAFSAGLIHIICRLVLLYSAPDQYELLAETQDTSLPEADAERRRFGESHRTLAPLACTHWDLPDRICSVLHGAVDPSDLSAGERRRLAVALRVGSLLAQRDLACEPFVPSQGVPQIENATSEDFVSEKFVVGAAEDAAEYASNVGGL
jgi:Predicted signal transduction protein